jgi:hypothetical protein
LCASKIACMGSTSVVGTAARAKPACFVAGAYAVARSHTARERFESVASTGSTASSLVPVPSDSAAWRAAALLCTSVRSSSIGLRVGDGSPFAQMTMSVLFVHALHPGSPAVCVVRQRGHTWEAPGASWTLVDVAKALMALK